ncbi:hypothetical protein NDJ00_24505 [Vibrio parahaemolyticus]|uniref:hypothetical protein n=1 Tax=Vibrio parahaemolyticus TaxID=670 RepID=UPI001A2AE3AA|nr:hypothetical protein [Vibrio parahaemolyticus]MCS0117347.1 hypothetical protein [Vibrio parahaemolyticus]
MPFQNKQALKNEISQFSYSISENPFFLEICELDGSRIRANFEIHGVDNGHDDIACDDELIDLVVSGYLVLKYAMKNKIELDSDELKRVEGVDNKIIEFITEYVTKSIEQIGGELRLNMRIEEQCSY